MTAGPTNVHATVIVVGTTGFAFVGASGTGKSRLAFSCLAEARRELRHSALVADDQVIIFKVHERIIALRPPTIAGLLELRYGGIVELESQRSVLVEYAVAAVQDVGERLPSHDERYELTPGMELPLLRLPIGHTAPLAYLEALVAGRHHGQVC